MSSGGRDSLREDPEEGHRTLRINGVEHLGLDQLESRGPDQALVRCRIEAAEEHRDSKPVSAPIGVVPCAQDREEESAGPRPGRDPFEYVHVHLARNMRDRIQGRDAVEAGVFECYGLEVALDEL